MDLVQSLAQAMGVDNHQATALAGLVLGTAKAQAGDDEAQKLEAAVPELDGWVEEAKAEAANADDEPGVMDDLARFASSGLGGSLLGAVAGEEAAEKAQLVALMGRVGLAPSHAALAAPVVLGFLKERLGETWFDRLMAAAPILTGVQQAAEADADDGGAFGVVAGALGGLFSGGR
jgi:hypothetical protein